MRRLSFVVVMLLLVTVGFAPDLLGKGGGGGGGGGRGGGGGGGRGGGFMGGRGAGWGWGGWKNGYTKPAEPDPKALQEETDKKVKKYVADGWSALRAGDTAAAYEAFSDALELNHNAPDAHFGMGLTYAAKGNMPQAGTELETANRLKADPRLVPFNMAVSYARSKNFGRSAVLFNRLINESKPTEELYVNAQMTLLANMTEAQKKPISVMPDLLKGLSNANQILGSTKYQGRARWGLAWAPRDQVDQAKAASQKETFPDHLPFLMPGDFPLPEKGSEWSLVNSLIPGATSIDGTAVAMADPKPVAVAVAGSTGSFDPKPGNNSGGSAFRLGGSSDTPAVVVKTTESNPTNNTTVTTPTQTTPKTSSVTRTVRGAAFAVAPDLLLTAARLVVHAKEIQLQTEEGKPCDATVVAVDETLGVALIKAKGSTFKPMGFAESAKLGPVGLAAFVKPTVFNPDLDVIAATLIGSTDKPLLRCNVHPRSAGSPFFDDQGHVMGLMTAARDDAMDKLPAVTVEVLKKFAEGKFTPASATSGQPEDSVVEMTVVRQD